MRNWHSAELPATLQGFNLGLGGEFLFPNLAPGTYSLEAAAKWHITESAKDVKVTGGAVTTVKLVMRAAPRSCGRGPAIKVDPIHSTSSEIAGRVRGLPAVAKGSDWKPDENALITATGPVLLTETGPKSGGLAASTRTDREGHFRLKIQQPGRYTITAHLDGYTDFMVEDIVVKTGQRAAIQWTIPPYVCLTWDGCTPSREFPPPFCLD